jgi:hypothetical protein
MRAAWRRAKGIPYLTKAGNGKKTGQIRREFFSVSGLAEFSSLHGYGVHRIESVNQWRCATASQHNQAVGS